MIRCARSLLFGSVPLPRFASSSSPAATERFVSRFGFGAGTTQSRHGGSVVAMVFASSKRPWLLSSPHSGRTVALNETVLVRDDRIHAAPRRPISPRIYRGAHRVGGFRGDLPDV